MKFKSAFLVYIVAKLKLKVKMAKKFQNYFVIHNCRGSYLKLNMKGLYAFTGVLTSVNSPYYQTRSHFGLCPLCVRLVFLTDTKGFRFFITYQVPRVLHGDSGVPQLPLPLPPKDQR